MKRRKTETREDEEAVKREQKGRNFFKNSFLKLL
jgi:hypothetical protein